MMTLRGYNNLESKNLEREMRHIRDTHHIGGNWDSDVSRIAYDRLRVTRTFLNHSGTFHFLNGSKTIQLVKKNNEYRHNLSSQIKGIKLHLKEARRVGDRR